ncbi:acyl-ACP desaturase [Mycolicibacterium parafortuitum]|uniref:Putative acyl-[acyl-carrier protein] desaturase DesA2 (Acyl-[ACP] desaturase) (Stearoyl-ACP desaturase) [Mycobacterium tuberculosis H37Rv] n=1 Tax=Mycolicibacterium parafortuitum TaxID=39692 RepID=A0A375YR93_MYCPF|nr:acyl-ACP desaturase [Mycolicibacterium parafortuitum]ORB28162.1 acyl-ACP desaturase [Mycolicibacterium parafortuitum]SRX83600.1 putative acyl-[acyl-carrier protein] desaturase DesA2 (acyl-[ACP] desaturase) (stearoyl-ACP desaturase) [Mycobacterium tuberculosis H37Rv] [Mycolicibacterium parafortuitum]
MAQKPVANALTLELEPVVLQELRRHLDSEEIWFAHDYVPFDQGENFAFLGGRDWEPSDVTLPKHVTDALEILLITKDNLAGYHRELVEHFILEDKWGRWMGRWTAEEHLHAIALRNYLVVTREIDPAANEDVRVEHVMKGYRADTYSQIETLAFMAFWERAHAVFCRNLEAQVTEPTLKGLIGRIAKDEERHEVFFANLVAHCLDYNRDETIDAIAARAAGLDVVGGDIDAYQDKVAAVADGGIFDRAALNSVIADRITAWGLAEEPKLQQFISS